MPKPTKGQIAGFAALGLLIALTAVAFYSSRQGRTAAASPVSSSAPRGADQLDVTRTPASPRVTESLPEQPSKGSTITAVAEDVMLSPQAKLLAERLMCVCGCGDILATCTCTETPGSRDMKKYLQQLVDEGKDPVQVEAAMVARYGEAVRP